MRRVAYGLTVLFTVAVVVVELLLGAPVIPIFLLSSLALVGLAWVLGQATEALGHHAGPRVGGILNATFGNAAELIITIFALAAGLTTVVKASIIGSIIGNVLLFVGAIEPLVEEVGISELFVGVIIVPIVGNIAEHIVGVQIAYKNQMDFSMAISLGSSIQVALLVTPILVFLGPLLGHPLRLIFTPLELGALGAAVAVTGFAALDGRSNWLEGAMLCGVYVIAALAFFFSP